MCKVFVMKVRGPSLDSKPPHKKLACDPSAPEIETGRSLGLLWLAIVVQSVNPRFSERTCLKSKEEGWPDK